MARDPHEAVDFAPAWLNFNNSNKKKTDKTSGNLGFSQAPPISSFNHPSKSSHDSTFRVNSLGIRSSPSRSVGNGHWSHQSPAPRNSRHQSADFSPSYLDNKSDHFPKSPNREYKKNFSKSGTFSPTFVAPKKDFSALSWQNNGPTTLHRSSGDGVTRLDTDFPSLSDVETSEQTKSKNSSTQGNHSTVVNMWQKPLVMKMKEAELSTNSNGYSKSELSSSIYKTLVPKSSHQKQTYRRTMSVPLSPSNSGNYIAEFITSGSKREHSPIGRNNQQNRSLHTNMSNIRQPEPEIQNNIIKSVAVDTGVVSGHKKHRKGKSHFLKTLCKTEREIDSAGRVNFDEGSETDNRATSNLLVVTEDQSGENNIMNGQRDIKLQHNPVMSYKSEMLLSSSLEAEHRLLREMGWKCSDEQAMEEEAPLTEDEIREFQVKCNGPLSIPATEQREKALQNAFSEWKFSGIRKKSKDIDNNNEYFFGKPDINGQSLEDSDSFSSDENES